MTDTQIVQALIGLEPELNIFEIEEVKRKGKKTALKIIILKMLFFLNYINKCVKKVFTLDFEEPEFSYFFLFDIKCSKIFEKTLKKFLHL